MGADAADRTATYVVPIIVNGTYRGFVGMGLDFQRVIDQDASIKFYESGYGFLTDADGNVMYHPSIPSGTNLSQDDEEVPAVDAAIAAGTTTEDVVVYRYHGSDKCMAFHLLRNDMRLVLSVSADELYEQGHDAGDELLRQATRQMNDAFGGHPVYRIGGDEFVVLIGEAVADACHVAEGPVSIACGSATYRPGEDTCVADVLARADTAMYECKRRMKQGR